MHQVYTLLYGILKMCAFVFQNWQNKVARNEKSLMSFRIPKIWQILKQFALAKTTFFLGRCVMKILLTSFLKKLYVLGSWL